jgi:hypothetical protein
MVVADLSVLPSLDNNRAAQVQHLITEPIHRSLPIVYSLLQTETLPSLILISLLAFHALPLVPSLGILATDSEQRFPADDRAAQNIHPQANRHR